jgi:uncharacterized protein (TIGR00369 family)
MTSAAPDANTDPALAAMLRSLLSQVFAPWVQAIGLTVVAARPGDVLLRLPVTPQHVHAGGVLCGQTMMAAADTAMVLAVSAQLGEFKPMTTVQLQTSFMRPVPKDATHVDVHAVVLRLGRSIVFGDIKLRNPDGTHAAHATTTYALL